MYFGFVDDVSGGSRTFEETNRLPDFVKKEFLHSGFIFKKISLGTKTRRRIFMFLVNFKDGTLSLTPPPQKKSLGSCLFLSWNPFTLQPELLLG